MKLRTKKPRPPRPRGTAPARSHVVNARRNPLRTDPTRTAGLRRRWEAELRRRFASLKARLYRLVVDEDAFGLAPPAHPFGPVGNAWSEAAREAALEARRAKMKGGEEAHGIGRAGEAPAEMRAAPSYPDYEQAQSNLDALRKEHDAKAAGMSMAEAAASLERMNAARAAVSDHSRRVFLQSHSLPPGEAMEPSMREVGRMTAHKREQVDQAKTFLSFVVSKEHAAAGGVLLDNARGGRDYYSGNVVHLSPKTDASIVCHEYGHHLERQPHVQERLRAFEAKRFGGEQSVSMAKSFPGQGFSREENGRKDDMEKLFPHDPAAAHYVGKQYPDSPHTEILSMGMELLHKDPVRFAKTDPEYFHLVTSILKGGKHERRAATGNRRGGDADGGGLAGGLAGVGGLPGGGLPDPGDDGRQPGRQGVLGRSRGRAGDGGRGAGPGGAAAGRRPVGNARFAFQSSPQQLRAFQDWLRTQVRGDLLGHTEEGFWKEFVEAGFRQGAARAFADVRAPARAAAKEEGAAFYEGGKEEFLRSAFAQPVAVEKVQLLAGRTYTEMRGVTETMATAMSRTLADGLVRGSSPREIAADLSDDVGIARGRALTVARTEIARSHSEGQLVAMEQLGVEQLGVMVEWLVTDDERLCPVCADLAGKTFSLEEAQGMLPQHPNCRCSWMPSGVGESQKEESKAPAANARRPPCDCSPALLDFSRFLAANCGGKGGTPGPCPKNKTAGGSKSKSKGGAKKAGSSLDKLFSQMLDKTLGPEKKPVPKKPAAPVAPAPKQEPTPLPAVPATAPSSPGKEGKAAPGGKTPKDAHAVTDAAWGRMTKPEQKTVLDYTTAGYRKLNSTMRKCGGDEACLPKNVKAQLGRIEAAIAKAPPLPEPYLVHRGVSVDPAAAKQLLAAARAKTADGSSFAMPSVTSASFNGKIGKEFTQGEGVLFRITAKHGLPVESKSHAPGEHEMILSSKAQYRVTKVSGNTIHLEQL